MKEIGELSELQGTRIAKIMSKRRKNNANAGSRAPKELKLKKTLKNGNDRQKKTKKQKSDAQKKTKKSASTMQVFRLNKKYLKGLSFRERLREQMKASRFRYFNEQFYISSSSEAKQYFAEHPDEFEVYHEGYDQQAAQWPVNPLDVIIKGLKKRPRLAKPEVIADFGCGKAKLAQTLQGDQFKVFSFDLIASNEYVTACDMANTNLFSASVDIVVFCLSLMGSNLSQFIKEANRVLKEDGLMKIAEVKSRFEKVDDFVENVEQFGFKLVRKDTSGVAFYYFDFQKRTSISKNKKKKLPELELKPCLYKQR